MQSVSDNTAINYDKSLENLISGASHLKETSHFFKYYFLMLFYTCKEVAAQFLLLWLSH